MSPGDSLFLSLNYELILLGFFLRQVQCLQFLLYLLHLVSLSRPQILRVQGCVVNSPSAPMFVKERESSLFEDYVFFWSLF